MAGLPRYTALLDACVLFPVAVCDALMSVAATGIYAARWTRRIDEEWTRSLEAYKAMPQGTFNFRRDQMSMSPASICSLTMTDDFFKIASLGWPGSQF